MKQIAPQLPQPDLAALPAPTSQQVPLADLKPHARNYNAHPQAQLDRLMQSLATFGQPRAIVVWRGQIIAGHGVAQAARQLGWATIRADVLSDEYPEKLALAYLVADNEHAKRADPDQAALAALLQELGQGEADLLAAMGYDAAELAALLAGLAVPEFKEYDESTADDVEMIVCPQCGHSFPK